MTTCSSFPIWPDGTPGARGDDTVHDIPRLTPYLLPDVPAAPALLVLPGGGYWERTGYEGHDYALWLNDLGCSAFVLSYRLASGGYHYPAMFDDATRAIRTIRARAATWQIDPDRVGVIGSSAGGHLASLLLVDHDAGDVHAEDPVNRESSRPDFGALCYPVICMELSPMEHLLGRNPSPELLRRLSSHHHVSARTPPCFLWHDQHDPIVPVEHSLLFARACLRHKVGVSLHIYPGATHGIGLGTTSYTPGQTEPLHLWTEELRHWLTTLGGSEAVAVKNRPELSVA